MAQTKKRRRRKHRGTQAGSVDRRRRAARPRSRQEARDRARSQRGSRTDRPPTWRGAVTRALIASGIFVALLILAFGRPAPQSIAFGVFMLAFYIPAGYFIDTMMWRRRQKAKLRER